MKLKTTYTPYRPSLLKSSVCFSSVLFLMYKDCSAKPVLWELPMIGHCAHDLYGRYQHNNSLIKTVELKLEGEKETRIVDMKPNFMDNSAVCDTLQILGCISSIMIKTMPASQLQNLPVNLYGIRFVLSVSLLLQHLHFHSDKVEFNFTDQKTGELISTEAISAAEVIGSEFLGKKKKKTIFKILMYL